MWKYSDIKQFHLSMDAAQALEEGQTLDLESLNLSSRDTYVAFVKDWKSSWHLLVAEIKASKKARRLGSDEDRSTAQYHCMYLRNHARNMLLLRITAKQASRAYARKPEMA